MFPPAEVWMIVGAAIAIAAFMMARRAQMRSRRRLFSQRLGTALSPRTIEKLADAGGRKAVEPGSHEEQVTVIACEYSDADKPALAETVHLSDATIPAEQRGHFHAFWNFPAAQPNHAARACAAALRWRKRRGLREGRGPHIGIHTGNARIQIELSSDRADFRATGAAVEIAGYLLRLNSCLGTEILISLKTKRQIGEKFVTRKIGDFKMPRREKPLTVYELIAPKDEEQDGQIFRDEFANALQLFQTGDFYHSQLTFQRLADENPHDEPTKFYLARLEEVLANPPDGIWEGVVDPKI